MQATSWTLGFDRHLPSVCTVGEAHHLEFSVMFSLLIGRKCAGKLSFGAYIRLFLSRGEVFELNMEEIRVFPLAGNWGEKSTPRSNPVNR